MWSVTYFGLIEYIQIPLQTLNRTLKPTTSKTPTMWDGLAYVLVQKFHQDSTVVVVVVVVVTAQLFVT